MASNTQVDLLDEDKPIAGQKFSCISFVSPENHIKNRELYYFENFVKNWDMVKSIDKFQSFLNFVGYKYNLQTETINNDIILKPIHIKPVHRYIGTQSHLLSSNKPKHINLTHFMSLLNDDPIFLTAHYMTEKFDEGKVILFKKVITKGLYRYKDIRIKVYNTQSQVLSYIFNNFNKIKTKKNIDFIKLKTKPKIYNKMSFYLLDKVIKKIKNKKYKYQ